MRAYTALLIIVALNLMPLGAQAVDFQSSKNQHKCIIGYGYSDVLVNQERQERFLMGFRYGLKTGFDALGEGKNPCGSYEDVRVEVVRKMGKGKLDALKAANELVSRGVILMAGFPTSHEAMLAATVAKEKEVGLVVSGASVDDLDKFSNNLLSTSPPNRDYLRLMLADMNKRYAGGKILVVAKKDSVFSMNMLKGIRALAADMGSGLRIIPAYMGSDLRLSDSKLRNIILAGLSAVYMTTYASESKQVIYQLLELLPDDMVYYVSGAWPIGDPTDLIDLRSQFNNPVRAVAIWSPSMGKDDRNEFAKKFRNIFKTYPPVEAAHGYEAGVYVANVLFNAKDADRASVLKSLRSQKCVSVDTVGRICRRSDGFTDRPFYWLAWTTNGFELE